MSEITARAALVRETGAPMEITEITIDDPGPREVRIRTTASSLCQSDLHVLDGHQPNPLPVVLGHEAAGIVESVGADVTAVKVGDAVCVSSSVYCGECRYCHQGTPHLCAAQGATERPEDAPPRIRIGDEKVHQMSRMAGFAEAILVHERAVVKMDDDLPHDRVSILGCAVRTGVGAVFHNAEVEPGSKVAVFGAGGIGIAIMQGALIAGARQIIAVDVVPEKLELAKTMGATDVIDGRSDDVVRQIKRLSGGGVDYAFDAAGHKDVAAQCFYALDRGGLAVLVGAVHPPTTKLELTVGHFFVEKSIRGCLFGSGHFSHDMPRYADLYRQGRLDLDGMITRRISLEEINEGFDDMRSGASIRSVIVFDDTRC